MTCYPVIRRILTGVESLEFAKAMNDMTAGAKTGD
jgi:hypothetical protein